MKKVSAVIITNNEEKKIGECLEAVGSVVDEIIVIDSESKDKTVEICQSFGVKVYVKKWEGYSRAKNFGNEIAGNEWILSIDADEILSAELQLALEKLDVERNCVYLLDRINNFCGKWIKHSGWYPQWKPRLFQRQYVRWEGDYVHEKLVIPLGFKRKKLKGKLLHYTYTNQKDHLDRIDNYAYLGAQKIIASKKKPTWFKIKFSPYWRFIRSFLLQLGFLDGKAGWIISQRKILLTRKKYNYYKILNTDQDRNADKSPHLRILHLSTALSWRGGEQQIAYLSEELINNDVEQIIYCPRGSKLHNYALGRGISIVTFPKTNVFDPLNLIRLKRACQKYRINILHIHDSNGHTMACMAATLLAIKPKLVLNRRVDFSPRINLFSRWKYNHPGIDSIICVSNKIKEVLSPIVKDHKKLKIVYSGIDLGRFGNSINKTKLRDEFKISSDTIVIGNVASLAPHKDHYTFINTAEILIRRGLKAKFLVVGADGGIEQQLLDCIRDKNLQEDIILAGFRDQILAILADFDLFLFTSKEEGLGTSLIDAMASGIPIVSTNAGGIPEIIEHKYNGLLAEVGDAMALADSCIEMINNEKLRDRCIKNAKKTASLFSKTLTAEKTIQIYRSAISH